MYRMSVEEFWCFKITLFKKQTQEKRIHFRVGNSHVLLQLTKISMCTLYPGIHNRQSTS